VDVLLPAVLDEFRLEEPRVTLDLIGGRSHSSTVNERLQVFLGVVRNADSACLLLGKLRHGPPRIDNGNVIEHLAVAIGMVRLVLHREKVVVWVAALVECDGKMNEIKVEVVETKLSKTVVKGSRHIFGPMLRVPQLGCDEHILALEARNTAMECLRQRASNLLLVAVDFGEVEVAVAGLQGFEHSSLNLTRLGLPGPKPQLAVQLQSPSTS